MQQIKVNVEGENKQKDVYGKCPYNVSQLEREDTNKKLQFGALDNI